MSQAYANNSEASNAHSMFHGWLKRLALGRGAPSLIHLYILHREGDYVVTASRTLRNTRDSCRAEGVNAEGKERVVRRGLSCI